MPDIKPQQTVGELAEVGIELMKRTLEISKQNVTDGKSHQAKLIELIDGIEDLKDAARGLHSLIQLTDTVLMLVVISSHKRQAEARNAPAQ